MQAAPNAKSPTMRGGHDPITTGRKGGLSRARNITPERATEIAKQARLALTLKHKQQLLDLVGPALESLQHALKIAREDPSALIKVVTAILDRTGFHGKSGIELEGDITHDHTGEIVHRHELLRVADLPLIVRRMMIACLESEWEPSPELTDAIRSELPMIQVKVELNNKK